MNDLTAKPAIMTMTLEITRAATGKVDVIEVICTPMDAPTEPAEQTEGETPCP